MSTVAGHDLPRVAEADESDNEPEGEDAGVPDRPPNTVAAGHAGVLPLSRKCAAAREGAAAHVSGQSIDNAIQSVGAGVSFCSAQFRSAASMGLAQVQSMEPAVPEFVHGGLSACRECSQELHVYTSKTAWDAYSYASEKARDAWSWWRPDPPPPAPRMTSMVSQSRAQGTIPTAPAFTSSKS